MSELDLLFEAARADGPRAGAKAKTWAGVAHATGLAASPLPVPAAAAAKSSALGATAGLASAVTIGLAAIAIAIAGITPADPIASGARSPARASKAPAAVGGGLVRAEDDPREPGARLRPAPMRSAPEVPGAPAVRSAPATPRVDEGDSLSREAQLLAEARGALRRGDPARALAAVRSARALPTRALEPEALSLEARALRGLDRATEAAAKDAELRGAYPDHALSR